MTTMEILTWVSAVAAVISLPASLRAISRVKEIEIKFAKLENKFQVIQAQPVMEAHGGPGGLGGGGGGASISNTMSQSSH